MPRELILCSFLLVACGDDAPSGPDGGMVTCTEPLSTRYQPLAVGATWTYDISEVGVPPRTKASTVETFEDVGDRKAGIIAFRVRTEKLDGAAVSWQEDRCTLVTRHREQSFDLAGTFLTDQFYVPGKLRIDESEAHVAAGARWTVSYTEVEEDRVSPPRTVSKDEVWTVEAIDEAVTVPAGTFTALKLRKTTSGSADKLFWFAKGVGKVKEQGEQLEELRSYTLP